MADSEVERREQLAYYREVADEYETHEISAPGDTELLAAIDAFTPAGDVLEVACGTGIWTEGLIRSARSVTALDAAPEMLRRSRSRLATTPEVTFIEADLFKWRPTRNYDTVFFGFWISHIPKDRFEAFWAMIDQALDPSGNVFFFDDSHRTEAELIEGNDSPIVQRRLKNGKPFRVVKIPYQAEQLEERLGKLGWNITVTQTSGPFYWGTGGRAH
jgi:protein-L-isoaspartate O-methyltransferase